VAKVERKGKPFDVIKIKRKKEGKLGERTFQSLSEFGASGHEVYRASKFCSILCFHVFGMNSDHFSWDLSLFL